MTKQTLRRRVAALSDRLWEMETRMRALELRLSEHSCDCTRHATPTVQIPSCWPVAPDGSTITVGEAALQPQRMWNESTFVRGWAKEAASELLDDSTGATRPAEDA